MRSGAHLCAGGTRAGRAQLAHSAGVRDDDDGPARGARDMRHFERARVLHFTHIRVFMYWIFARRPAGRMCVCVCVCVCVVAMSMRVHGAAQRGASGPRRRTHAHKHTHVIIIIVVVIVALRERNRTLRPFSIK